MTLFDLDVARCYPGKIFSLMAAVENLSGLAAAALYEYFLYPLTVDVFAGFCFVIASIITVIPTAMDV